MEIIITAVEKRRILYDSSIKNFNNAFYRRKAWDEVSKEVCLDVSVCQKKWKGIRDYYRKKKHLSSLTAEVAKTPSYFTMLTFLDPFLVSSKTETNFPEKSLVNIKEEKEISNVLSFSQESQSSEEKEMSNVLSFSQEIQSTEYEEIGETVPDFKFNEKRPKKRRREAASIDVDQAIIKLIESSMPEETTISLRAKILAMEIEDLNLSRRDEEILFHQLMMSIYSFKRSDQ